MTISNRIVLSSDHAAVALRQAIAAHVVVRGWAAVDIGPTTAESTHYPAHGEAAALRVASGDCRFGIVLCGTGQGIMMAANKIRGIRCGVCSDTYSARMIRQHNDANMLALGARMVGEGPRARDRGCVPRRRFRGRPPRNARGDDRGAGAFAAITIRDREGP